MRERSWTKTSIVIAIISVVMLAWSIWCANRLVNDHIWPADGNAVSMDNEGWDLVGPDGYTLVVSSADVLCDSDNGVFPAGCLMICTRRGNLTLHVHNDKVIVEDPCDVMDDAARVFFEHSFKWVVDEYIKSRLREQTTRRPIGGLTCSSGQR
jgi:hypothetical protein